jgi:aldose 1-epimerase
VWLDGEMTHVQLFTGDTLATNVRRKGLAIEPMSCAPNAFGAGSGYKILEVGEMWKCSWGVATGA